MSQWMSSPGRVARTFDRLLFGTGRLLIFPYRHASHVSVEYPLKSSGITPGSSPAAASCLSLFGAAWKSRCCHLSMIWCFLDLFLQGTFNCVTVVLIGFLPPLAQFPASAPSGSDTCVTVVLIGFLPSLAQFPASAPSGSELT